MGTVTKLDLGAKEGKARRKQVIAEVTILSQRLTGMQQLTARGILKKLKDVQRNPALSNMQKENKFREILQATALNP